ncbi:DUF1289 domain-containing protein [Jiella endophytica]|uniref:DUF1289 domain-containing protein n=1 Tax=Jiella endophytica TaxID=2558362 RepID=A0A4Y8RNT2_9HYPH|nr:DUF1289 domain-containing protein [Jiella endophytica]TFF25312.1 DUF1289 domain-containing protein [Jiella endophytica]
MAIESPCTLVCTIDPATGLCLGCRRTIDEIAGWASFAPDRRRAILADLAERPAPQERPDARPGKPSKQDPRPRSAVKADAS